MTPSSYNNKQERWFGDFSRIGNQNQYGFWMMGSGSKVKKSRWTMTLTDGMKRMVETSRFNCTEVKAYSLSKEEWHLLYKTSAYTEKDIQKLT